MSLNKFTDVQKGKDIKLKIGCENLECNNAQIDNLIIDEIKTTKLEVENDTGFQFRVKNPTTSGTSYCIVEGGDRQQLSFLDSSQNAVGTIQNDTEGFSINPNNKQNVQILSPLQLEKTLTQTNPPAEKISLYAKQGSDSLFLRNSAGDERDISPLITSGTYLGNFQIIQGATNLTAIGLAIYYRINNIITVSGQFSLTPTSAQIRVDLDLAPNTSGFVPLTRHGVLTGAKEGSVSFVNKDIVIENGRIGIIINSCNNIAPTPVVSDFTIFNFTLHYQIG